MGWIVPTTRKSRLWGGVYIIYIKTSVRYIWWIYTTKKMAWWCHSPIPSLPSQLDPIHCRLTLSPNAVSLKNGLSLVRWRRWESGWHLKLCKSLEDIQLEASKPLRHTARSSQKLCAGWFMNINQSYMSMMLFRPNSKNNQSTYIYIYSALSYLGGRGFTTAMWRSFMSSTKTNAVTSVLTWRNKLKRRTWVNLAWYKFLYARSKQILQRILVRKRYMVVLSHRKISHTCTLIGMVITV